MPRGRKLALHRERLHELDADELARVNAGQADPVRTQLCNCTGTSHPVTGLGCLLTLERCIEAS